MRPGTYASISAMPRPWAMPPWIWPSTSVGLIARPTSWAATIRRTFTVPRSRSTSTSATWAPKAYVAYGIALPVGVERRRRGVVRAASQHDAAATGGRQLGELHDRRPRRRPAPPRAPVDLERRLGPGLREGQQLAAQVHGGEPRRAPGHEGLARGRGLAGVEREVGVGTDALDRRDRDAEGVGGDLGEDRVRALADVGGAGEQDDRAVGPDADLDLGRVGHRGGADAVPRGGDADPAPDPAGRRSRWPRRPRRSMADQRGRSASRQAGRPALATSSWDVAVREPARSALRARSSSGSMPSCPARSSMSASWAIGRLRDAEPAEGAGRRPVAVHGAAGAEHRRRPRTGPSRGPARGWRPSAPRRRTRRCRSRRGRGRRSGGHRRRRRTWP